MTPPSIASQLTRSIALLNENIAYLESLDITERCDADNMAVLEKTINLLVKIQAQQAKHVEYDKLAELSDDEIEALASDAAEVLGLKPRAKRKQKP